MFHAEPRVADIFKDESGRPPERWTIDGTVKWKQLSSRPSEPTAIVKVCFRKHDLDQQNTVTQWEAGTHPKTDHQKMQRSYQQTREDVARATEESRKDRLTEVRPPQPKIACVVN